MQKVRWESVASISPHKMPANISIIEKSSSVVFLQVSQMVMNQLPLSRSVLAFFLKRFTAFWGAVLSYYVLQGAKVC